MFSPKETYCSLLNSPVVLDDLSAGFFCRMFHNFLRICRHFLYMSHDVPDVSLFFVTGWYNVLFFLDFEHHHFEVFVGDYIPNSWLRVFWCFLQHWPEAPFRFSQHVPHLCPWLGPFFPVKNNSDLETEVAHLASRTPEPGSWRCGGRK